MLQITVPPGDMWDEKNKRFIRLDKAQKLQLEHSLISISKWESKWHVPFFSETEDKTQEQTIDYIKCMTLNSIVDPLVYDMLTPNNMNEIMAYIKDPMTATWFAEDTQGPKKKNSTVITNEVIYYKMVMYNIPAEYQKWHINRLITLIRVCDEKNKPQKKLSKAEIMERNRRLNAERRKRLNSKG